MHVCAVLPITPRYLRILPADDRIRERCRGELLSRRPRRLLARAVARAHDLGGHSSEAAVVAAARGRHAEAAGRTGVAEVAHELRAAAAAVRRVVDHLLEPLTIAIHTRQRGRRASARSETRSNPMPARGRRTSTRTVTQAEAVVSHFRRGRENPSAAATTARAGRVTRGERRRDDARHPKMHTAARREDEPQPNRSRSDSRLEVAVDAARAAAAAALAVRLASTALLSAEGAAHEVAHARHVLRAVEEYAPAF